MGCKAGMEQSDITGITPLGEPLVPASIPPETKIFSISKNNPWLLLLLLLVVVLLFSRDRR